MPTMPELQISHRDLTEILLRLQAGINASDLHGSLTGYLCAGGSASADAWTEALALDFGGVDAASDADMKALYRQCLEQLDDVELGFEPLMPADEIELAVRAEALVDWCRGFLGGVGLAGGGGRSGTLSGDAREIVQDFGTIAASSFDYTGGEEDESALAEVIEFIRVGVLLLYSELATGSLRKPAIAPGSRRVH
jgi:uncharacterized protein